jgi:hypothetical protein
MSQTPYIHAEVPEAKNIWVPCGPCDRDTCHQVLASATRRGYDPESQTSSKDDYFIVQCQGCKTISFCHGSGTSEDWDEVDWEFYPSRIAGRSEMRGANLLGPGVYRIYKETHAALCNKLPVLASIGIRTIVEAVCKEKTGTSERLYEQIDALVSLGLVTAEGAQILHNLRFMGNQAAHEVKAHTEEELNAAFDVTEYLLRGVYVIPQLATRLPRTTP